MCIYFICSAAVSEHVRDTIVSDMLTRFTSMTRYACRRLDAAKPRLKIRGTQDIDHAGSWGLYIHAYIDLVLGL